jgi:hypothetical protein
MDEAQFNRLIKVIQLLQDSVDKNTVVLGEVLNLFKKYEVDEALFLDAQRED